MFPRMATHTQAEKCEPTEEHVSMFIFKVIIQTKEPTGKEGINTE